MNRRSSTEPLDRRMARMPIPVFALAVPRAGWIRAVRDALGMSGAELARRLGVSQPAVAHMERSERHGSISLGRLRKAADALECDLVYALVPRAGSFEATVRERAEGVARQQVGMVRGHMELEDQAITDDVASDLVNDVADRLVASRHVWRST